VIGNETREDAIGPGVVTRGSAGFSQSLGRGLQILTSFSQLQPVLGIADIARAVKLNKSTTHRYVATLTQLEYLQQDPVTRKYELGPRVADLGFAAISSLEVTRVATRHLQALSDETGYPVSMAILDGPDIVYVDRRRSARLGVPGMDLNLQVGSRLPAYCTSMGKVLLADLDATALRLLLDRTDLARTGPRTITAREHLMSVLSRARGSASPSTTRSSRRGCVRWLPRYGTALGALSPRSTSPCT